MKAWYRDTALLNADERLRGSIVVAVPHSDDEVLGCGIVLSQIRDKSRVRFVYASDGSRSPAPTDGRHHDTASLSSRRIQEARSAIGRLGYAPEYAEFLGLPDGHLSAHVPAIADALAATCRAHSASILLAPFRLDVHPDHLAVHRAARAITCSSGSTVSLYEYFVYFRSRLLPLGDVRAYLRPEFRLAFHTTSSAAAKRAALDCYASQRTTIFPWQTRPVLQDELIDETVSAPEFLLHAGNDAASNEVLRIPQRLLGFMQTSEFQLKRCKDRLANRTADRSDARSPSATTNDRKVRVCLMTETFYPVVGGGETQALALSADLASAGHTVIVVTRRSENYFAPVERLQGFTIHRLGPSGAGQLKKWAMLATATTFLIRNRRSYDIILVSGYRVLGIAAVAAARMLGKRCILKADNNGEMSGEYFIAGIAKLRLQWARGVINILVSLRNGLFRQCDAFVALSNAIRSELLQHGVRPSDVQQIPNGYDPARFHPVETQAERNCLRQTLGLPLNGTLLVFTGRLLRSKGLPLLMRVWREMARTTCDATLVIVGSGRGLMGSCEDEIRNDAERHGLAGRVVFAGSVRNVEDYLRASDIFVFPTEDEAFGISLIEAMACGLPCIATSVGGINDIITNGVEGLLFEPGDAQALHATMHLLMRDPVLARRIGAQAARSASDRFRRDAVARTYVDLFNHLPERGLTDGA